LIGSAGLTVYEMYSAFTFNRTEMFTISIKKNTNQISMNEFLLQMDTLFVTYALQRNKRDDTGVVIHTEKIKRSVH
jgi:hypothetical protein